MYFHRTDTAIEDFKFIVDLYEKNNGILSVSDYESILKNLIKACGTLKRTDDAKLYKEKFQSLISTEQWSKRKKVKTQLGSGQEQQDSRRIDKIC